MKKQKRWMKSVIDASKAPTPALPFGRGRLHAAAARKPQSGSGLAKTA